MTIQDVARTFTDIQEDRPDQFSELAEAVFVFQREHCPVYSRYCKAIPALEPTFGRTSDRRAHQAPDVPYLPIAAFKAQPVATFPFEAAQQIFESSGTGSGVVSRHYVRDLGIYERSLETHFRRVFGDGPFVFATHLPHYVEQGSSSSLLFMVEHLLDRFGVEGSGSFLADSRKLDHHAELSARRDTPLIVFGTAFGLLELVESRTYALPPETQIIETGGMKTYRREISRDDLHGRLSEGFGVGIQQIRSEYGMCELLSQCYTRGEGIFYPPPWMRFAVLDTDDPFREAAEGEVGALALFDLANMHTVSAVLTEDRAVRRGGGFEVKGRLTGAELRGCNFLLENIQS